MFRKLRPFELKITTALSIKSKKSQHSINSVKSGDLIQEEENRQMIHDRKYTRESPLGSQNVGSSSSGQEQPVKVVQRNALYDHQNGASGDSLAARYRCAVDDSVQSTLIVQEKIEEEIPLKTAQGGSSTSSSESDFDWNETDESELDDSERQEREQRKFRQVQEHEHTIRHAKRLRRFYLFLMKFSTPVRTAIVGFLGSSIAITPAILVWLKFTHLSARNHILAWSLWLSVSFATSCSTSIIVDILPAIALKLFDLLYGAKPEKLKTQVELWMNVRYWTKVALGLTCYWVVLSLMFSRAFRFHEDPNLAYFEWVMKVTAGLFTAGAVLLLEKILLQVIQLNFHRTSLQDRLEENERALWALDRLSAAKGISHSPKKRHSKFLTNLTHNRIKSGVRSPFGKDSTIVDVPLTPNGPTMDQSGTAAEKSTSGGMASLQSDKELGLADHKKHRRQRSSNFYKARNQRCPRRHGIIYALRQKLAKKLFEGLDEDCGGVITRNEFEPYFKTASDAAMAFKLFDKDGNGDIDRKEMRNAVVRIYRERRALAIGLKDMSSAVSKLDAVLISIACVLTIFICFFIFNSKGTSSQLVPMATIILGFSFIFGNAAKNLFESMLFIFSIHPYDVGDMVSIDEIYMFVMEFGLFSTTFQRVDGQVVVAPTHFL
ncbi:hypothetical protein H4Q26_014938 [Puccinia striiformis f. sp. tritici PST-130]|nr:hypothetical protein H4Q26_014938 [Puccinia striiformis f. sp. tritici PST-130]